MAGQAAQIVSLFLVVFFAGIWVCLLWLALPTLARTFAATLRQFHHRAAQVKFPARQTVHAPQHTLP